MREKGVDHVYKLLKDNFVVNSVDSRLRTLYALPWRRIYTTNYDNAPEVARSGVATISSITPAEPQSSIRDGSIVHLNGFIQRISPANLDRDLLLTDTSYAASRLVETGWLSTFERDLNTSRAVIFAGYSLYDLDIDRVLLAAEALSKKTFFFISPDADKVEISTLSRYGTVVVGGIDVLIDRLKKAAADYRPTRFVRAFSSLRELSPSSAIKRPATSSEKVLEQLVYGQLPEQEILARENAFSDQPYLITRKQDRDAIHALKQGPWRDVVVAGEIASGKSSSTLGCILINR